MRMWAATRPSRQHGEKADQLAAQQPRWQRVAHIGLGPAPTAAPALSTARPPAMAQARIVARAPTATGRTEIAPTETVRKVHTAILAARRPIRKVAVPTARAPPWKRSRQTAQGRCRSRCQPGAGRRCGRAEGARPATPPSSPRVPLLQAQGHLSGTAPWWPLPPRHRPLPPRHRPSQRRSQRRARRAQTRPAGLQRVRWPSCPRAVLLVMVNRLAAVVVVTVAVLVARVRQVLTAPLL